MILGAAQKLTNTITNFNQLVWIKVGEFLWRANINSIYYVTRDFIPGYVDTGIYRVYKNNTYFNSGTRTNIDLNIQSGFYNGTPAPPPVQNNWIPAVITPQTPAVDPGPGNNNSSGDLLTWFSENQIYIYGAAAILAAAFLFKKKK